jgi:hypothetical protein
MAKTGFVDLPGADKSLARPNSRSILFDGGNISFDASLVICIDSTNIPPIIIEGILVLYIYITRLASKEM